MVGRVKNGKRVTANKNKQFKLNIRYITEARMFMSR